MPDSIAKALVHTLVNKHEDLVDWQRKYRLHEEFNISIMAKACAEELVSIVNLKLKPDAIEVLSTVDDAYKQFEILARQGFDTHQLPSMVELEDFENSILVRAAHTRMPVAAPDIKICERVTMPTHINGNFRSCHTIPLTIGKGRNKLTVGLMNCFLA